MLEEFSVTGGGVKVNTIEEGDAKAHEESDDDEAKASAEGVNESEPVNPTLWVQRRDGEAWPGQACSTDTLTLNTLTSVTSRRPIR